MMITGAATEVQRDSGQPLLDAKELAALTCRRARSANLGIKVIGPPAANLAADSPGVPKYKVQVW
jgi:hypothetical protein